MKKFSNKTPVQVTRGNDVCSWASWRGTRNKGGHDMLKIALCDDNKNATCQYAEWIHSIAEKHQIQAQLSCFNSGESLLAQYSVVPECVDIIYLDILMYETDGMETARRLRGCGCKAQIIFLTSYDDYVFQAFDVDAVHYLMKEDTSTSKFEEVFLKAAYHITEKEEERFVFEFDGKTSLIPFLEIAYFETWKNRVIIHYGNGMHARFYSSMEQVEQQVAGRDFARAHRSYLVHLPYIASFESHNVVLKTGAVVPIGITYAQKIKETFGQYILRFHSYKKSPIQGVETI
jgi:DNA-binding LytR/AlgR family response regulator